MCRHTGPTLYEFSRDEIKHAFGAELVAELDALAPQR
jgi:hypothetical protein